MISEMKLDNERNSMILEDTLAKAIILDNNLFKKSDMVFSLQKQV